MQTLDIVLRLLCMAANTSFNEVDTLCTEAADEIERLRAYIDALLADRQSGAWGEADRG